MQDRVSVIIPTYNRAGFIHKAVDSVLAQTYHNFELIVVDDGSTDETAAIIARYRDKRLVYLSQENLGASAARNTGIRAARYDLFVFLDSDDWFHPEKLALQTAAMHHSPDYLISHTEEIWYRRGVVLNQKTKHKKNHGDIFLQSLKLCAVGMSTVMARRRLFEAVGMFDESMPCCEDYDLWLKTSVQFPFLLVDKPLTYKDGGRDDQLSVQHRIGMDKWRIGSLLQLLESNGLSGQQILAVRREVGRKCTIYGNGCLKHGRRAEGGRYLELARRHSRDVA